MSIRVADRRHSLRTSAAYRVTIRSLRRRVLARGRTANISENGVFVVIASNPRIPEKGQVYVDLTIPADPAEGTRREVCYRCDIVRRQELGNLLGLGLELVEKVS